MPVKETPPACRVGRAEGGSQDYQNLSNGDITPSHYGNQESRRLGDLAEVVAVNAGLRSLAHHAQAGNLVEAAKLVAALGRCWSDLREVA